jgi:low temperature requirement protein LtrA
MRRVRRQTGEDEEARASTVELFFDLVFVFFITRLSDLLLHDLTVAGAAKTVFLFLVAWWAWIYTTWGTNWFDPTTGPVRAVLLVGMLASMLGAIAIPDAFGDRAWLLVVGYVSIQTLRNAFMVAATDREDPLHLPFVRILVWTAWVGLIWLAGLLVGEASRVPVWAVALGFDYLGPLVGHWTPFLGRSQPQAWELEPSHFVERIMLFLIIALGETIVAGGFAASELPVTAARVLALAVSFGITTALWWLYFEFHAERTLHELRAAASERGRLGRDLSYLHIPLALGIIVAAVGTELVISHPGERLSLRELIAIAAGPVLYLLGSVAFKLRVFGELWERRAAACVALAGTVALASRLPALAIWALVLVLLTALAVVEAADRRRAATAPGLVESQR